MPRTGFVAIVDNSLGGIRLPYSPINSITAVYDYEGVLIDPENYFISGEKIKRIDYPVNSYIKAVYDCGFTTLPGELLDALLSEILWRYQNRGDAEKFAAIAPQVAKQLSKYRYIV